MLPVSRELIKAQAKHEAEVRNITPFTASDGWFKNWRWRHCVSNCIRPHGEAGEVDLSSAEQRIQVLRDSLGGYPPDHVFNMDKAGLFYRTIPNRSYLLEN